MVDREPGRSRLYSGPKFRGSSLARVYRAGRPRSRPRSQSSSDIVKSVPERPQSARRGVQSRLPKHGCLPARTHMPPTASPTERQLQRQADDLGGLIEQERLPAGRDDLPEPLVAHSQRERLLNAMAAAAPSKGYGATTIADICEPRRRLPRHLLRALQGQGGLLPRLDGALPRRRDGPHRRGLLARQALGDDGPRRRRRLPRPARQPARPSPAWR